VSQRTQNYSVKIGEDWYGGFGPCPVSRGQRVVVSFYEKDGWNNIGSIRSLMVQAEPELSESEIGDLQELIRQRNYEIAEQSIEDAKRLLANSGLRNAVTAQNVVTFAERLAERRILHASRIIEEFARKKRFEKKSSVESNIDAGVWEEDPPSSLFGKVGCLPPQAYASLQQQPRS
jgi:hypothetical protein